MIYSAVAALLVFGSCSTAYQTAQTPDDVYYSPAQQRVYASNNQQQRNSQAARAQQQQEETFDEEGDNYVTYADEDEERYDYARRIDRFGRGYSGNYWDGYYFDDFGSNLTINNYYGYNSWNRFGWNSWYGPSMSIGFGFGRPWGGYGGWYGSPWYGSGWYGNGWYGGGYGHGWYGNGWGNGWYGGGYPGYGHNWGGGYYAKPRPSNSWGPRGSSGSRVYTTDRYNNTNYRPNGSGSAPRRQFDNNSGRPVINDRQPSTRRTFDRAPGERPANQPAPQRESRRTFERNYDRGNDNTPSRQQSQPSYTPERSSAPQRSYTPPSSSPGNNSSPAPTRTYRPRGR